ncbi:MAG: hypothetical protein ABII12_05165 [Planctomycetota bacterium]
MSVCPSDFDLDRYHAGEMDDGKVGRVRKHLASCGSCAKRDAAIVAEHEDLVRHVRDLKGTFRLDDDADSPGGDTTGRPESARSRPVGFVPPHARFRRLNFPAIFPILPLAAWKRGT